MGTRDWIAALFLAGVLGVLPVLAQRRAFELDEVLSGALSARGFSASWISDNEVILSNSTSGDVLQYNVETGAYATLIPGTITASYNLASYSLSADRTYILLKYDSQSVYRHSTIAKYAIYSVTGREVIGTLHGAASLQLARWNPVSNSLVYVYLNNIYYVDSVFDLSISSALQLTTDGIPTIFYNGVPDWVYEEEVFSSDSALWFSPDGTALAYAVFNDTDVEKESYFMYGEPGDLNAQYSELITMRYPKPGTDNPVVSLMVLNLINLQRRELEAPIAVVTDEHILWDVSWPNNNEVIAIWKNRIQNVAQYVAYNISFPTVPPALFHFINETEGWLDLPSPVFDDPGTNLVSVQSWPQTNSTGKYFHLTHINRTSGSIVQLSTGKRAVVSIYGWDAASNTIYYRATDEDLPSSRHVYAVAVSNGETRCLSCNVNTTSNRSCQFAAATFSKNFTYYALTCSGPDPAHVDLYNVNGSLHMAWQDNQELRNVLNQRLLPVLEDTRINVTGGYDAHVRLWLPPNLDRSGNTKYPMVVYVYAGPDTQQISDAFTLGWGAYLVTNRSYIYALIDGRGSSHKGHDMLFEMYLKMGQPEIEDQISVTRALQQRYPFIDANRTGIWGWSYGGYATSMALAKDTEGVFKCGIAVAPVSSWIYYDTIYTERYMRLPTNVSNLEGYNRGDVTQLAENFTGKDFYLMHGTADDNVHYMHAMALARALEEKGVLFSQQSYPDENHSIRSLLSHVYHSQDKFWSRCFQTEERQPSSAVLGSPQLAVVLLIFLIQRMF